jgi:hypothetical protein
MYKVYIVNADESKSPCFTCESIEEANVFIEGKEGIFSIEFVSEFGSRVLF